MVRVPHRGGMCQVFLASIASFSPDSHRSFFKPSIKLALHAHSWVRHCLHTFFMNSSSQLIESYIESSCTDSFSSPNWQRGCPTRMTLYGQHRHHVCQLPPDLEAPCQGVSLRPIGHSVASVSVLRSIHAQLRGPGQVAAAPQSSLVSAADTGDALDATLNRRDRRKQLTGATVP